MDKPNDRVGKLEEVLEVVKGLFEPKIYTALQFQSASLNDYNTAYNSTCRCERNRPDCSPECYCLGNEGFCILVCNSHEINCCATHCNCDMNW